MPSIRMPFPSGLGISTRRTGCGTYVPLSSCSRMRVQCWRQVRHQVIDGHAVDARCSVVTHHPRVCGDEILPPHDLLDERQTLVPA